MLFGVLNLENIFRASRRQGGGGELGGELGAVGLVSLEHCAVGLEGHGGRGGSRSDELDFINMISLPAGQVLAFEVVAFESAHRCV